MSLILQIETATTSCSVALAVNGKVIASRQLNERNKHAEVITLFIESVFQIVGKQYTDLDAVAVSSGPGSYTGLRIGVSTVKGLCFSLDKPLIAIETLQAMANGYQTKPIRPIPPNALLCPMIDARRMEVFTALYRLQGEQVYPISAEIISETSFSDFLNTNPVIFFGDGAEKCREVLGNHSNAMIVSGFVNNAEDLSTLALGKYQRREFVDTAYFEPYYLKDFIPGIKKG
ncbi:MAG: tRNA (adenosine(37)-N6)-threonylcarbamoyltransferase complex dimerization subunit type 1 TsaB [Sphingobacteriaceae bacterium]